MRIDDLLDVIEHLSRSQLIEMRAWIDEWIARQESMTDHAESSNGPVLERVIRHH